MKKVEIIAAALMLGLIGIAQTAVAANVEISAVGMSDDQLIVLIGKDEDSKNIGQEVEIKIHVRNDFEGHVKITNSSTDDIGLWKTADNDDDQLGDSFDIPIHQGQLQNPINAPKIFYVKGKKESSSAEIEAELFKTNEPNIGSKHKVKLEVIILSLEVVEVIETGETAGCTGYDKDEKALMVPMQGSNKIKVKIAGAPQEILQNIKFVSEPAGKLTIAPEDPTAAEQELTISGTTSALGVEVKLEIDGVKVDLFEADVLKQKNASLNVRAIINEKTGVVVSTPPVNDITEYLELFLHQANVIFDEITVNNVVIDYDKNGDGAFNYTIHEFNGFTELDRLYEKAPRTDNIDYYIFKNINPGGGIEAVYINSQNIIVAKDNHDKCTPLFIMAHEIGHALGRAGHWDNEETHADYLMANGEISNCGCVIGRDDWRAINNQD